LQGRAGYRGAMRILSLNAWGGRLVEPLLPWLAEVDADVLCLQEVTRTVGAVPDWLAYRDGDLQLPQRANLFDEVRAVLPDHDATFSPAGRGLLFDGRMQHWSEFGLATFARRGLPMVGQILSFVHGSFIPDGWGPHPRARNAYGIRLCVPDGGMTVSIVQMHGLRDPAGKADTPARCAQAERLADMVERLRQPGDRTIVCGDFNVLPGSVTFEALGNLGMADLVVGRGHGDTRTSHYTKAGRFADYMMVSREVDVRRFEVVAAPEVSDHRALLLDIA
jgi:endonuclease/exonuclease/phosphatase family metal-dependent hydrolase